MYFIPQITQNDCAYTCLKILLANTKNNKNFLYLKEDENREAYSYAEIVEIANSYGVNLIGFRVDDKNELYEADNLPLILTIRVKEMLHSIYVYQINKNNIFFWDPQFGKRKMKISSFIEMWEGSGLMVKELTESANNACPPIISAKGSHLINAFQLIGGLLLGVGIYFIDSVYPLWISISFLTTGLLIEVVTKLLLMDAMKKYDKISIKFLENVSCKNYEEFLRRKESYKQSAFSMSNNIFFYLIVCSFLTFAMLFSNPLNIGCVFLPILLAIFQSLKIRILENDFKNYIEEKEVNFSKCKSFVKAQSLLNEIQTKSYAYVTNNLIKNVIGIFLFGICAVVSLVLSNSFSFVNAFFLVFTEIYLYQNLVIVFSFETKKDEKLRNHMKLLNIIKNN